MKKHTNIIPTEQHILDRAANTLLALGNFAKHADTIADAIRDAAKRKDFTTVFRMADMLVDLATEADNTDGLGLSAEICELVYSQVHSQSQNER